MNTYQETKKALEEIKSAIKKNADLIPVEYIDLKYAEKYVFGLRLKNYGFDIDLNRLYSRDWEKFGKYSFVGFFDGENRTIKNQGNIKQPVGHLFGLVFPTGPYIFGVGEMFKKDYPEDFFTKFWNELETYNPDYVDKLNRSMYWKVENAAKIFNEFDGILKKYQELNKEDFKARKIKELEEEIEKLKSKS